MDPINYKLVRDWFQANSLITDESINLLVYREDVNSSKRVICFVPASSASVANGVGQDVLVSVYVISKPNDDFEAYDNYLDAVECASEDGYDAVPNVTIRGNYRSKPVLTADGRVVTEFLFTIR